MSGRKTFPSGGIELASRKSLSRGSAIRNALIPPIATVPLLQHLGTQALCLVKPGDRVEEGMAIGGASGPISARVHSPIPGVVTEIAEVTLASGQRSLAVRIELDGSFSRFQARGWPSLGPDLPAEEIVALLADGGVVGLGGALLPSHLKLSIPKGEPVDVLVVNAVECEPYLTGDYRLLVEKPRELAEGIRLAARVCRPKEIILALDQSSDHAIEALAAAAAQAGCPISAIGLRSKYPQGDEKQLLKALIGREIPPGETPLAVGAIVVNVATVYALFEAVVLRKPLFERVVTVSGGAVRSPANLKVRFGTPIGSLIEECGGLKTVPKRIVAGGPFIGHTVLDLSTPVTKGVSGVVALTAGEVHEGTRTPCIGCGRCTEVCPMGLNPIRLLKQVEHSLGAEALEAGLLDCKECGCCSYVCPARVPLVEGLRLGKRAARSAEAVR